MSAIVEPVIFSQSAQPVRLCPWRENFFGLVSLWDMVTFDAGRLCNNMMFMSMGKALDITIEQLGGADGEFGNLSDAGELLESVRRMCAYCIEMSFPMTRRPLMRIIELAEDSVAGKFRFRVREYCALLSNAMERLRDEAESIVFLRISQERVKFYSEPREGWKEVIARFPDAGTDIEESSICFALDRYAASVFHIVQAVEVGLIALGQFIGVKDPKSGWTATANALDMIIKKKYSDLTTFESQHIAFLKQVHATVAALQDAWRNKISHAQGRLQVLTADFSPHVAEEIFMASRGFLRRLATDLP